MERPPDEHGDDQGHSHVHGPRVRPAEQLRECLQPGARHLQGQGRQVSRFPPLSCAQCCGSETGIRYLFDPRIRGRFFPNAGSRYPDLGS